VEDQRGYVRIEIEFDVVCNRYRRNAGSAAMVFVVAQLFAAVLAASRRRVLVHVPFKTAVGSKPAATNRTLKLAVGRRHIYFLS
jgi:hypothetical protein